MSTCTRQTRRREAGGGRNDLRGEENTNESGDDDFDEERKLLQILLNIGQTRTKTGNQEEISTRQMMGREAKR